MILGFDPGRDKCGVAVMTDSASTQGDSLNDGSDIVFSGVVAATDAVTTVLSLIKRYRISTMVMGNQTTAKQWKSKFECFFQGQVQAPNSPNPERSQSLSPESGQDLDKHLGNHSDSASVQSNPVTIVLVDERYSTLEARDRYWQLYPPTGLAQFIPKSLRTIPRPVDDVVAIILIERYRHIRGKPSDNLSVYAVP
ncbi:MAG: hypothetical protein AAGD25_26985 [Cyanobacteria bacterium P01_F01_bin.150]